MAPSELPEKAESIFHIPALSGSGVAYFFAKELFQHFNFVRTGFKPVPTLKILESYFYSDYLALAAIGTIADLIPLVGPSRSIVYHGLKAFKETKDKESNTSSKKQGLRTKI